MLSQWTRSAYQTAYAAELIPATNPIFLSHRVGSDWHWVIAFLGGDFLGPLPHRHTDSFHVKI